MDLGASFCGLVALGPLLLGLAVLIKLTSPGPVFYRGLRAGRGGRSFRIFKFRSMVVDAEKLGGSSTADRDPRITWIGGLMRRFKLDELPQLINVLVGDMSLVGPRPEVPRYVEMYRGEEREILTVRPGITDWASVWNSDEGAVLAGAQDPDKAYEELIRPTKLRLQLKYVRERKLFTDVKLVIYTLLKIVRKGWVPRELAKYPRPDARRTPPPPES
jgi:lipopolysaccharide/colanic/teichoic acid biosynthesis glycosyltransferase